MTKVEKISLVKFKNIELSNLSKRYSLSPKSDFKNIERQLVRKLRILLFATNWQDLVKTPGNHAEKLKGSGLCSIRINNQYRLIFIWEGNQAWEIDINKHGKNYGK